MTKKNLDLQAAVVHRRKYDKEILKAISNPKYAARTISGIETDTSLSKQLIVKRLGTSKFKKILKVYPRRSSSGKVLITTKSIFSKKASLLDKFTRLIHSKR